MIIINHSWKFSGYIIFQTKSHDVPCCRNHQKLGGTQCSDNPQTTHFFWVNYNDLTVLPHYNHSKGNHPQMAQQFRLVKYYNLPRIHNPNISQYHKPRFLAGTFIPWSSWITWPWPPWWRRRCWASPARRAGCGGRAFGPWRCCSCWRRWGRRCWRWGSRWRRPPRWVGEKGREKYGDRKMDEKGGGCHISHW